MLRSPNVERNYSALFSDVAASPVRGKEPSIATANNIDTLLGATESSEIVQPPEAVQDKVHRGSTYVKEIMAFSWHLTNQIGPVCATYLLV